MRRILFMLILAVAVASCRADVLPEPLQEASVDSQNVVPTLEPSESVETPELAEPSESAQPDQPETVTDSKPPASVVPPEISPGALSVGSVEIDGTTIDYVTIVPAGFEAGDSAPVVLAFPPGPQTLNRTKGLAARTYEQQAVARGWVVVSPAAPNGRLFFQGSEQLVPSLLDWIETWVQPEAGKVHVIGRSNGGLSAFRVATQNPDRVASLLTFPGFPRDAADIDGLSGLTAVPIRMFVGENDRAWARPMQQAFDLLVASDSDVTFEILPGERHTIASMADGVRLFDELEAARPG